ncbi:MAG: LPS export ABC transporter periplasmic protein LptC [Pseudomonadota bacterium]|nr:LPS export ABC transporter periplasmic protein LptC [Pseudomonadota bacterium]
MRYALPVVAGVVFLLLVILPELTPKPDRFALGISDLNVEIDGGQRVVNARFTGVDSENRPFSITADSVVQDKDAGSGVKLSRPKADVTLPSESWVAIAAPNGTFWRKREVLNLVGGVDLFHDKGYEFRTQDASIDFRNGDASGDKPVQGQGPFGTISAEGFRITDSGGRIFFSGKSTLVIFPTGNKPGA